MANVMGPSLGCFELEVKPCPMMTVSKAPVLIAQSRKKPLSNSQEVLFTLLNKRFHRYLASQTRSSDKFVLKNERIDIKKCSPVKPTNDHEQSDCVYAEKRNNEVTVSKCSNARMKLRYEKSDSTTMSRSDRPTSNKLEEMGCQELAEHVVNKAKVRLRRRPKPRKIVSKDGSCNYNTHSPKKVPEGTHVIRRSLSHNTDKSVLTTEHSSPKSNQSPVRDLSRRPAESGRSSSNFPEIPRSPASFVQSGSPCKTVYFSERQSIAPKDTGIPNVPPSSPDSSFACCHNYIQSLCDKKGQRQLRSRLQDLCALRGRQESAANRESQLEEKRKHKEEGAKLKAKQRAEIYALNGTMRTFEEEKFREFISGGV